MTTILDPTNEAEPVIRQIAPRSGTITGRVALLGEICADVAVTGLLVMVLPGFSVGQLDTQLSS